MYLLNRLIIFLICIGSSLSYSNGEFKIFYGLAESQGRRPSMEDAHCIHVPFLPGNQNSALFAIFDGHGGQKIAQYCADNIGQTLKNITGSIESKLNKGLVQLDKNLAIISFGANVQSSGTCAILALFEGKDLYIANIGDSRAVLSKNGRAISLSTDHKPDRADEKARIENLGGHVSIIGVPRVMGILAVSRAIGDHALRKYGVISEPEILQISIKPEHQFLILACDGIYEAKMSCQDAINVVKRSIDTNKKIYKDNSEIAKIAAQDLIKAAYNNGSGDNLSAIVVVFEHL